MNDYNGSWQDAILALVDSAGIEHGGSWNDALLKMIAGSPKGAEALAALRRREQPISWRSFVLSANGNGTMSSTVLNERWKPADADHLSYAVEIRIPVLKAARRLRLVFGNYASLYTHLSKFSIRVAVTTCDDANTPSSRGMIVPVHFSGNRDAGISPNGMLQTDSFTYPVAPGQILRGRLLLTAPDANSTIPGLFLQQADQINYKDTYTLDQANARLWTEPIDDSLGYVFATGATSPAANVMQTSYGPLTVLGDNEGSPWPAVALCGDSIMAYNTQYEFYADPNGDYPGNISGSSYAQVLKRSDIPYVNLSQPGESLAGWLTMDSARHTMLDYVTHVLCNYGTNDIAGGSSLAALQANVLQFCSECKAKRVGVYWLTLLPRTNSTNVPAAGFQSGGIKDQFNAWLVDSSSDGAVAQSNGALAGVIDTRPAVQDPADSGKWIDMAYAGGSGIHPTHTGGLAIANFILAHYDIPVIFGDETP